MGSPHFHRMLAWSQAMGVHCLMGRALWGGPSGGVTTPRRECRRRSAACEGIFFSNQKNIPSRFPRKILGAFRSRPQTPPTTKGRAAPFFGNHPGVYGDFCYEGRWNRERKMRAGCLWSFQAFHLAGDEVGDGLVDLEPAFVDCRGGALSPPGFWGLMDVL